MQPGETDNDKKTVSFALFTSAGLPASGEVGEGAVAVFSTTELQISYDYGGSYTTATGTFAHGGDGSYRYRFADSEVQTSVGEKNIWLRYKTSSFRTMVLEVPLRYDTDRINTKLGTPAGVSVSADIAAVKAETAVITTINTKLGTPVLATVSADIASVKSDTAGISAIGTDIGTIETAISDLDTKIGTPASTVSDDIADVKSDTSLLPAAMPKIDTLHRVGVGRWKIQGTQLLIYEEDEESVLIAFNLLDSEGEPTNSSIYERVPA